MTELRQLTATDRSAWLDLRCALYSPDRRAELDEEISKILSDDRQAGFGLFDGDKLVGFSEVRVRDRGDGCETAPVAWVESIFVAGERRRTGLGGRLVGAMEQWASDRGLLELGSDVALSNDISRHSHEDWGFEETCRLVLFRKRLK